jgi:hypothetical protein
MWVRESHLTKIPSLTLRSNPFIVKNICADYLAIENSLQEFSTKLPYDASPARPLGTIYG